jgi:hypothetical protein
MNNYVIFRDAFKPFIQGSTGTIGIADVRFVVTWETKLINSIGNDAFSSPE